MKITIVQGAFFPVPPLLGGAVEKAWYGLGQAFAAQGHSVFHVSRSHPDLARNEVKNNVFYQRIRGSSQPRSLALLKLKDLLYSLRAVRELPMADILVTNTFWLPFLIRGQRKGQLYINVNRY